MHRVRQEQDGRPRATAPVCQLRRKEELRAARTTVKVNQVRRKLIWQSQQLNVRICFSWAGKRVWAAATGYVTGAEHRRSKTRAQLFSEKPSQGLDGRLNSLRSQSWSRESHSPKKTKGL